MQKTRKAFPFTRPIAAPSSAKTSATWSNVVATGGKHSTKVMASAYVWTRTTKGSP